MFLNNLFLVQFCYSKSSYLSTIHIELKKFPLVRQQWFSDCFCVTNEMLISKVSVYSILFNFNIFCNIIVHYTHIFIFSSIKFGCQKHCLYNYGCHFGCNYGTPNLNFGIIWWFRSAKLSSVFEVHDNTLRFECQNDTQILYYERRRSLCWTSAVLTWILHHNITVNNVVAC